MKWEDMSENARDVMQEIGNFGPTTVVANREVKGWTHDKEGLVKTYWTSDDLRNIAAACVEVAKWLDRRDESRVEQEAQK